MYPRVPSCRALTDVKQYDHHVHVLPSLWTQWTQVPWSEVERKCRERRDSAFESSSKAMIASLPTDWMNRNERMLGPCLCRTSSRRSCFSRGHICRVRLPYTDRFTSHLSFAFAVTANPFMKLANIGRHDSSLEEAIVSKFYDEVSCSS